MLNQGNFRILFLIILFSCTHREDRSVEKKILTTSYSIINQNTYSEIFNKANDSISIWSLNKLGNFQFEGNGKEFKLDSILCFNRGGDRLIAGLLNINSANPNSDGIDFFYGEKINNEWYFFRGGYIVIPREMVEGQDISKPISYQQLHKIALKEVYGGYLNSKGEINEEWFTVQFEGPGWGDFNKQESSLKYLAMEGKPFTDRRKFFEAIHLQGTRNNWLQRDTTKPILQLP